MITFFLVFLCVLLYKRGSKSHKQERVGGGGGCVGWGVGWGGGGGGGGV